MFKINHDNVKWTPRCVDVKLLNLTCVAPTYYTATIETTNLVLFASEDDVVEIEALPLLELC